jgi:hypothetical protein
VAVAHEGRKVYRARSQAIGIGCVLLIDIALGVGGAVRGGSHSTIGFVFGGVLLLLIAIPVARGALAVLIITNRGVTVRNPFRTVSMAWDEIAAFELGRYKVLGCVCLIRHRDRTVVPAFAIQGITGQPRRRTSVMAKEAVDELNSRLRDEGGLPP